MNEVESRAASGLIRLPQSFVELNTAGEQSEGQTILQYHHWWQQQRQCNDADYMYVRYVQ